MRPSSSRPAVTPEASTASPSTAPEVVTVPAGRVLPMASGSKAPTVGAKQATPGDVASNDGAMDEVDNFVHEQVM